MSLERFRSKGVQKACTPYYNQNEGTWIWRCAPTTERLFGGGGAEFYDSFEWLCGVEDIEGKMINGEPVIILGGLNNCKEANRDGKTILQCAETRRSQECIGV